MVNFLLAYGTLKRNYNNHFFLKDCKFIGIGYTIEKFRMFNKGYPYVVFDKNGYPIRGEVYEIKDEKIWKQIDDLEDYPDEYDKTIINIRLNNKIVKAFLYYYKQIKDGNEIKKLKYNHLLNIYYLEY